MCWGTAAIAAVQTGASLYSQRQASQSLSQDPAVQREMAALSREQYDDYISRFRPHEIDAVYEYMNPAEGINRRIGEGTKAANEAWDASRGITSRALSDYKVSMDADQAATRDRMYMQDRSASIADINNRATRTERERHLQRGDELFQTGRNIEGTSSTALASAARSENQRQAGNAVDFAQWRQRRADTEASLINTGGTLASAALARRSA